MVEDKKRKWLAIAAWGFFVLLSIGNILNQMERRRSTLLLVLWSAMLVVSLLEVARAIGRPVTTNRE